MVTSSTVVPKLPHQATQSQILSLLYGYKGHATGCQVSTSVLTLSDC